MGQYRLSNTCAVAGKGRIISTRHHVRSQSPAIALAEGSNGNYLLYTDTGCWALTLLQPLKDPTTEKPVAMTCYTTPTAHTIHTSARSSWLRLAITAATLGAGLGAAMSASAADLYRWAEADGSITFSPKRPPAGVEYTVVDTATMTSEAVTSSAPAPPSPVSSAASAPLVAPNPATAATAVRASAGLAYAPAPDGSTNTDINTGISAGQPAAALPATAGAPVAAEGERGAPAVAASASKRAQCEELEKRVVSLERRLSAPLTPEDMDNTVLYMARYQQSVDRFCRS